MSLTIILVEENREIYIANITDNLVPMAKEAGVYEYIWKPKEKEITKANQLIHHLKSGLDKIKSNPDYYKTFNPKNEWGSYDVLVSFMEELLEQCDLYPNLEVESFRYS